MDHKANAANITLIHHQLVSCNSEVKLESDKAVGGVLELSTIIEVPDEDTIIKEGENHLINLTLTCTGKTSPANDVAFSSTCKMKGVYKVISLPAVELISTAQLWNNSASQLLPVAAQFLTDLISRMGYKNVSVPPFIPNPVQKTIKPKTIKPKVKKQQ